MFGIDDMILLPMVGAALGGLTNKKNPLQGAALGGALGYGGAALPGLLGGATAGAVEVPAGSMVNGSLLEGGMSMPYAGMTVNGMNPAGGMSLAEGANVSTAMPKPMGLLSQVGEYAKPAGQALSAANTAKGLVPQKQQMPAPQVATPMPNSNLGQMVQGFQQEQQMRQQIEEQKRNSRRGLL